MWMYILMLARRVKIKHMRGGIGLRSRDCSPRVQERRWRIGHSCRQVGACEGTSLTAAALSRLGGKVTNCECGWGERRLGVSGGRRNCHLGGWEA